MTTIDQARMITQLGARLDDAAAEHQPWQTLEPLVRRLASATADLIASIIIAGHYELQPSPSNAVAAFDSAFVDEHARSLASTVRASLVRSREVALIESMHAEVFVLRLVHDRFAELFGAASAVAGRA